MKRLENLPGPEKSKVYFTHLNHTNPALNPESDARKRIEEKGFRIASGKQVFPL